MTNLNEIAKNFDSKTVEKIATQITDSLEGVIARPSRARWFLVGAALGALGVYFLDPSEGTRRRRMVADKTRDLTSGLQRFGQEQWENIQDKATSVRERVESNAPTRH